MKLYGRRRTSEKGVTNAVATMDGAHQQHCRSPAQFVQKVVTVFDP
ncbi:MAG: hypothetical protein H6617_01960 [Bdellovibrionaceae bacterium]|nr:hypothetical protein [Pseudobdellovibrionaceae bacterium]